jgi:uncharacterized protein YraI
MKMPGFLVAAMLLVVPTAAFAARGIVTTEVSMRAGPGTGFPVVDRIPGGARVNIHGCLRPPTWCDVSWDGERGWVSAEYLEYFYRNRYVYLPEYVEVIDVPYVPFVLSSYWSSHYAGRPWYHRRAHWNNYWQSNARFAARRAIGGSRGFAATQARGSRAGFADVRGSRVLPGQSVRGERFSSERMRSDMTSERMRTVNGPRGYGPRGTIAGTRQPLAAPHGANRFSGAPVNRPAARADVGRVGGPPMQARGHFGAQRSMGGIPSAGPGGGNRFSGAPMSGPVGRPSGHVSGPPLQAHGQMGAPRAMGGGMPAAGPSPSPRMGGAAGGGGGPVGAPRGAPPAAAGPAGGPPGHRR